MAYGELSVTEVVQADGTAVISVTPAGGINTWVMSQVTCELPEAPIGATCELRKNGNLITPMIPTGDTAAQDPSVPVRPTDTMTLAWTGCTPGDVARGFFIYDDGRPA